jgi:hypothetical protein
MSRSILTVISVLVVIAVLAASGCTGIFRSSNNTSGPGVVGPQTKTVIQPRMVGDMYNMSYFWNDVDHCRLSYDLSTTFDSPEASVGAYTFDFQDRAYNGTPAREMIMSMEDNTGFNMTFDLYFKKTSDSTNLTILGGHARIPDFMSDEPGAVDDIPITPEMLEAEATANYTMMDQEAARLGVDHNDSQGTSDNGLSADHSYAGVDFRGIARLEDEALDITPVTYVRTETLTVGGKSCVCSVYNSSFTELQLFNAAKNGSDLANMLYALDGKDIADSSLWTATTDPDKHDGKTMVMTYWYSPEFPAMPLKYVYSLDNGNKMIFTVEDFR